ncbi:MAG: beta-ketoacyl synthase chain length factor [Nevskiales bacterium]
MSRLTVWAEAPGVAAPGLNGWTQGQAVLRGEQAYLGAELPKYAPTLLPPNERRRATNICRLAFQAAEEAIQRASVPADSLAAVFASSSGDLEVLHLLCEVLATPQRQVSPTHFHNSVHNAPAGYWSIATRSRMPSTSLSACDASVAAGLLEAAALCAVENMPVLLVAYDIPPPPPLLAKRPVLAPFGAALVLTSASTASSGWCFQIDYGAEQPATQIKDTELERLRTGNPAARMLPLLALMARQQPGRVQLTGVSGSGIQIEVTAC